MKILNLAKACIDFPTHSLLFSLVRHRSELATALILLMGKLRL